MQPREALEARVRGSGQGMTVLFLWPQVTLYPSAGFLTEGRAVTRTCSGHGESFIILLF